MTNRQDGLISVTPTDIITDSQWAKTKNDDKYIAEDLCEFIKITNTLGMMPKVLVSEGKIYSITGGKHILAATKAGMDTIICSIETSQLNHLPVMVRKIDYPQNTTDTYPTLVHEMVRFQRALTASELSSIEIILTHKCTELCDFFSGVNWIGFDLLWFSHKIDYGNIRLHIELRNMLFNLSEDNAPIKSWNGIELSYFASIPTS